MACLKRRRADSPAPPRAIADQGTTTPTTASIDSDDHVESLAKYLEETVPELENDRPANTYKGEALPRSGWHQRYDYKASNFATLPTPRRKAAHYSVERGDSEQMTSVEVAATASRSPTRTPLIVQPRTIIKGQAAPEPQPRELVFSLSSVEGMTRYGRCFIWGGLHKIRGGEEAHAVLWKLQEVLAHGWSLARTTMSKLKTEKDQELMREKVRILWGENLLMAFGGTVVPCDDRGDPFVGTNKYVQGALEALIEFLSSDDNEWVHEDPATRIRDPHVWTRKINDETAVVKIKRRSQIIWVGCGDTDLIGFRGSVASRFEESQEPHVTDECMRVLKNVRADRARRIAKARERGIEVLEEPASTFYAMSITRTRGQRSLASNAVDCASLPSKRLRLDGEIEVAKSFGSAVGSVVPHPKHTPKLLLKVRKPSNSQAMSTSASPSPSVKVKQRDAIKIPVVIPAMTPSPRLPLENIDANAVGSPVLAVSNSTIARRVSFTQGETTLLLLYFQLKFTEKSKSVHQEIKEKLNLPISVSTIRGRIHKLLKRKSLDENMANWPHEDFLAYLKALSTAK